jgi:hypothetical protein
MHNKKLYNKMFEQPKKEREHGTQPKGVNNALTHQALKPKGNNQKLTKQKVNQRGREECNHKGGDW